MNKALKTAFTLIELLVVMAIIGILSGLIIIGTNSMLRSANLAKAQVFSSSLRDSLLANLFTEWKFDGPTAVNSAATTNDAVDTWGSNDATAISATVKGGSDCVYGKCLLYNGTADYVEISDSSSMRMTAGGTVSAWIYPRSSGGSSVARVIDKSTDYGGGNGYMIYINSNRAVILCISGCTNSADSSLTFNQWQLLTVSFNALGRKIYINGIDKTASGGGATALPPDVAGSVRIGNKAGATDRSFDGYIDEMRIFNAVVPSSKIKETYYLGLNKLLANQAISKQEYFQRTKELFNYLAKK